MYKVSSFLSVVLVAVLLSGCMGAVTFTGPVPAAPDLGPGEIIPLQLQTAMKVVQDASSGVPGTKLYSTPDRSMYMFVKSISDGFGFVITCAKSPMDCAAIVKGYGFTKPPTITELTTYMKSMDWEEIEGNPALWSAIAKSLTFIKTPVLMSGAIPPELNSYMQQYHPVKEQ